MPTITIKRAVITIVALVILGTILGSFGSVSAQQRGIRLRFGAVTGDVLQPGLYFKTPWIEDIVKMDVRVEKTQVEASAASKDLQNVTAQIAVNYQLDPKAVVTVYEGFGKEYAVRIIDPAIQEAIKAATAQYSAEELVTKRSAVRDAAKENLRAKVETHGITLVDFNIVDFNFSAEFNKAIEAKVTQEQTALAEQNKLKTVEYQAKQAVATAEGAKNAAIAQAQGEAEAIRIKSEALRSNPDFLKLQELDVQKAWATKWGGTFPTVMGGSMPFINIPLPTK